MSALTAEIEIGDEAPVFLYRCFSKTGALLYIGITGNLKVRMTRHQRDAEWWPQRSRTTVVLYPTRELAECAETAAIYAERPLHNDQHTHQKNAGSAHLGIKLMQCRTKAGISRVALARAIGLHPTLLGAIERGDRHPTRNVQDRIAAHLGVTLSDPLAEAIQRLTEAYERASA